VGGLLFGFVAPSAGATIRGSSATVLARLGARGSGTAAVLGVTFLVLAVLLACLGVGQLTAARAEEADGRLDHLLAAPVTRPRWLAGRCGLTVAAVVVGSVAGGLAAWAGVASQHGLVGAGTLVTAGLNTAAPALALVGLTVLVFGTAPRATAPVGYGLVVWSLLVVLLGGFGTSERWVEDTSVFHHMTAAPAVAPDWGADLTMVAIGGVAAVIGGWIFTRRDLAPA
jgi:ABC-2 type transport system permease protein